MPSHMPLDMGRLGVGCKRVVRDQKLKGVTGAVEADEHAEVHRCPPRAHGVAVRTDFVVRKPEDLIEDLLCLLLFRRSDR